MDGFARGDAGLGRPVPTQTAFVILALGLLPSVLTVLGQAYVALTVALDAGVLLLCAVDFLLAPRPSALRARRTTEPILSSGVDNRIVLEFSGDGRIRGDYREPVPAEMTATDAEGRFELQGGEGCRREWRLRPSTRGDLLLGPIFVRVEGPLGLCARQFFVPLATSAKVYPDLKALSQDALLLAAAAESSAQRVVRRVAEGSEFESLREYRNGDDYRSIDWKASARKGRTMVRQNRPERNQVVMLLLDCGRHMAGRVGERRKLDHAVDAALRLARVCLEKGDRVGCVAFGSAVKAHVPPLAGAEGLKVLAATLYKLRAELEESDYGAAIERAFARQQRRSLVVAFTDLLDPETSDAVVRRMLSLRPRHLPMVASLLDDELVAAANAVPETPHQAFVRETAARLEDDYRKTTASLRDRGALVVRAPATTFSAAAVNEYLRVKARGML